MKEAERRAGEIGRVCLSARHLETEEVQTVRAVARCSPKHTSLSLAWVEPLQTPTACLLLCSAVLLAAVVVLVVLMLIVAMVDLLPFEQQLYFWLPVCPVPISILCALFVF